MIEALLKLATELDAKGLTKYADRLDQIISETIQKEAAAKKPNPVFKATHPKVTDDKDHFPLGSVAQARNALAQASKFKSEPKWWSGSLTELVGAVQKAVKRQYPSIKTTDKSKKPGKG